jgi:hypothetical protein
MSKTDKLSDDEWNNYLDGLNKYADTIAKTAKELAQENLNNYVIPKSKQTDSNTCGY